MSDADENVIQLEIPVIVQIKDDKEQRDRSELLRAVAAGEPASFVITRQRRTHVSIWPTGTGLSS